MRWSVHPGVLGSTPGTATLLKFWVVVLVMKLFLWHWPQTSGFNRVLKQKQNKIEYSPTTCSLITILLYFWGCFFVASVINIFVV